MIAQQLLFFLAQILDFVVIGFIFLYLNDRLVDYFT